MEQQLDSTLNPFGIIDTDGALSIVFTMILIVVCYTRTLGSTVIILTIANITSYTIFDNSGFFIYLLPISLIIIIVKIIQGHDIIYKISKLYEKFSGKKPYGDIMNKMSFSTKVLLILGLVKVKKTP